MRRIACLAALAAMLLTTTSALAQDRGRTVFLDTVYGVLTGAIVGGALTLTTDKPGDHLAWVGVGAAVGAVGGAVYGMYETTAMAELDDHGELRLAMPTVMFRNRGRSLEPSVDVLRVRF
ncbi:MAG: hypothetical protein P1P84_19860 [Deferrisomatales bacterium]|nr:hypothetical protein [Deferrisomatales bacterium]